MLLPAAGKILPPELIVSSRFAWAGKQVAGTTGNPHDAVNHVHEASYIVTRYYDRATCRGHRPQSHQHKFGIDWIDASQRFIRDETGRLADDGETDFGTPQFPRRIRMGWSIQELRNPKLFSRRSNRRTTEALGNRVELISEIFRRRENSAIREIEQAFPGESEQERAIERAPRVPNYSEVGWQHAGHNPHQGRFACTVASRDEGDRTLLGFEPRRG